MPHAHHPHRPIRLRLEPRRAALFPLFLPILSNVFLKGSGAGLVIGAQNGDMALAIHIPQSEGRFSTTLPAARLLGIARELGGQQLSLGSGKKGTIAIKCGAFAGQIATSSDEFPAAPKIAAAKAHFSMPVENLRNALRRTVFAVSHAPDRPAIGGVRVVVGADEITCVATDGLRLALERAKADVTAREIAQFTIPADAVAHLLKAVAADEGDACVRLDGAVLLFETKLTTFSTKVVDIAFPKWEVVIPKPGQHPVRVGLNRDALLASISRTTIISNDRVVLDVRGETLRVSTCAAAIGESEDSLPVKRLGDGQQADLRIAFSPALLADALRVISADELVLEFADPSAPLVLEVGCWKYVAMPIRSAT